MPSSLPTASCEAGLAGLGQIDLLGIAADHHPRAHAEAGQEHLHLLRRGVLRLVEDDEGVGERAAAHEGDRRDLDLARRDAALDLLGRQHVVERVVERPQIGIDLLLHVAGQEAEPLAGLDRGARQDQPVDAAADQLLHRLGDGEIGLAGAGRARARRSCRRGPAPPYRRPAPWSAARSSSCGCGSSPWAARSPRAR